MTTNLDPQAGACLALLTICHLSSTLSAMPTATATVTKRARTRDSLLAALQELLLDSEASPISVPQVVARCGVAQGTFYNYFDSLPDAIVLTDGAADDAEVVARSARQTLMLLAHRPDVGRLLFDSGLPADRFIAGVRAHLHADLQRGIDSGVFAVADFEVVCTVYAGVILGASLDLYRRRISADAIPEVVEHLLGALGVSKPKARRLVSSPQGFVQWRGLPLSAIEEV